MRSALGYADLPTWTSVFAFGRFRSSSRFFNGWGYSALIQGPQHRVYEDFLCVSSLRDMGGIFRRPKVDVAYNSHGVVGAFPFPPIGEILEGQISDCPAAPGLILSSSDFSKQRCFCLAFEEVTVWLPKLELAGQMFFFERSLIRSAFSPGALDFNFCLFEREDAIEIRALPDVGILSWAFDQEYYRRRLGWLLTKKDVRDSFFSIWLSMNKEKTLVPGEGYVWDFNFTPPASLSGSNMTVMGSLSEDKKHLLVWEVVKIEVPVKYDKEIIFIHPDLEGPGPLCSKASNGYGLLNTSTDSIAFIGEVNTSVSYSSER